MKHDQIRVCHAGTRRVMMMMMMTMMMMMVAV